MTSLRWPAKPVSSHWPGALPLGLVQHRRAFDSTSACLRLFDGMAMRHAAARACKRCHLLASRRRASDESFGNGFAGQVIFCRSQPTHETRMSMRPSAVRIALTISLLRSPTMVLKATVTPISLSFSVM